MITFSSAMLSNCIRLLSIRSWIQCLSCVHSLKVCSSALKWCSHFLDGSKPGIGNGENFRGSTLGYQG